jgi:hypothetical protein
MALTTLCPHCKVVCTIPDSAVGLQVACSRCKTVFTADPFVQPKKPHTNRPKPRRVGALAIFLMLLGASGTMAIVVASIVFFFYQFHLAMNPPEVSPPRLIVGGGGMGFGMGPPNLPLEPEVEDKNAPGSRHVSSNLALLSTPPPFAIPKMVNQGVDLNRHPRVGEYTITFQTWLQAEEKSADGSIARVKSRTLAELTETVQAVDPSEQASVRLRYRGYVADASRDGVSRTMPLAASADLARASAFFLLNEKGEPTAHRMDMARSAVGADATVKKVHETQRLLFEFFSLPLPNETAAKPGVEWSYQRVIPFQFSDEDSSTQIFEAHATLRGAQRTGADVFAVIEIRGKLKGAENADVREARGWALVDSLTGTVMQAQAEIPFAITLSADQMPRQIKGTLHLSAQRQVPQSPEDNN